MTTSIGHSHETHELSEGCAPDEVRRAQIVTVIVPLFMNAGSIPRLCEQLSDMTLPPGFECRLVFVVDGSPDESANVLRKMLESWVVPATVVELSRNFGSFAAIRAGLEHAEGDYFAVISADLQEPPSLVPAFVERLARGDVDLVLGQREDRTADPFPSRVAAAVFWRIYRRWVQPAMPFGGVDVFACNAAVRATILDLEESNSSLVGQLLWVGFRRTTLGYQRLPRLEGKSAWTLSKKLRYLSDSIFSFTDLPIRFLLVVGVLGCVGVLAGAALVATGWWLDLIDVPGYTPIMLAILLVGFVLILGLGIVGSYVWRTYENSKHRPLTITQTVQRFPRNSHD
jgi:glycosyltransferase involved in cell wall biosynthesis